MLVVETIAKIRRAHFIDGKSIKQICRELRVSRNTVRKVKRLVIQHHDRIQRFDPDLERWVVHEQIDDAGRLQMVGQSVAARLKISSRVA